MRPGAGEGVLAESIDKGRGSGGASGGRAKDAGSPNSRPGVNATGPERSKGPERGLRDCIGALNWS